MKSYVKPDVCVFLYEFILLEGLSLKDEEGGDQLTNGSFFDEDYPEITDEPIWDKDKL